MGCFSVTWAAKFFVWIVTSIAADSICASSFLGLMSWAVASIGVSIIT